MDIRRLDITAPKIQIEGVAVSINPFASIHGKQKGKETVGCLSLLINKTEQSSNTRAHRCRSAAILSLQFAQKHLSSLGAPVAKLCMVYDVFDGRVITAPVNHKRQIDNMRAQCEEVADRWDLMTPPDDYDGPDY